MELFFSTLGGRPPQIGADIAKNVLAMQWRNGRTTRDFWRRH
jgi:hypothetical protein